METCQHPNFTLSEAPLIKGLQVVQVSNNMYSGTEEKEKGRLQKLLHS